MSFSVTCLIPARAGSKGIPNKNLLIYKKLPLICHSILHAQASEYISDIVVSTDSEDIARISRDYGAEVPFLRPPSISADETLDFPVFEHYLHHLTASNKPHPDLIVHLRPTSPDRPDGLIDTCITKLVSTPRATAIRTVSPVREHPYRMYYKSAGNHLSPYVKDHPYPYELRRQDLLPLYYYNCCVDVTRASTILEARSMTGSRLIGHEMTDKPRDIDTPSDFL